MKVPGVLLLSVCAVIFAAGCERGKGGSPVTSSPVGDLPAAGPVATVETAGDGTSPPPEEYSVIVSPSSPSRLVPPGVSVKSPPGKGAEVTGVRWFVNGSEAGTTPILPRDAFQRGDRVSAEVKLRIQGVERSFTTAEGIAVNSLPEVTDVGIEPRAPIRGGVVRAVVQGRDPDGDPLTFRYGWSVDDLPRADSGESLHLTGVKKGSWIHVRVTPNDGAADGAWRDSPRYQVVNGLPIVKSGLPKELPPARRFVYPIVAVDPDGDPLTYTLKKGPPGMVLNGHTLEWPVPEEFLGQNVEAEVVISDGDGGETVQKISMTIRRPG